MRLPLIALLLASLSTPAFAAAPVAPPAPPPAATLPPEIAGGRMVDQLGSMVGALTKALLNLPIGEVEAAVENRSPNPADRTKTVRTVTGMDEQAIDAQIAQGKGAVKNGGQALSRALPVIVEALNKAGQEVERATANLPQPGYPRR